MRVTVIAPEINHTGGQERVTLYLVRKLLAEGHSVRGVTRAVDPALLQIPSFTAHLVPGRKRPMLAGYLSFLALATIAARRLPASDVTVNTENTALVAADLAYSHYCHSAYRSRRGSNHGSRLRSVYNGVVDTVNSATEQIIYQRLSTLVVAVSNQHRDELVHDAHVPIDKVRVVHNGVDTSAFYPAGSDSERLALRRELGLSEHHSLLLFAGDLRSPRKGLDTAIRAVKHLPPDVRLVVAGDTHRSPYPAVAERAGVSGRVQFLGFRADLARVMRACDVFVLPTRYDPCSLVVPEAMASGLPPITTAIAGASEIITDRVDGLVLPDPEDDRALANSIEPLLRDPERLRAMRAAASETAQRYDWSRVTARVETLLLSLAQRSAVT